MGGWELCKHLRAMSDMPIIFLTALGDVDNMVLGLEMGADDYLVKPFESRVLLARIKAHLRRLNRTQTEVNATEFAFSDGDLRIDLEARTVHAYGDEVSLTPREFDLLATLAKSAGKVIPTKELVSQAWSMTDTDAVANIKPYIHYLRKKLEADPAAPRWIMTARGVGYRLADD
jgi:DNA-binding response OmpR family regulator